MTSPSIWHLATAIQAMRIGPVTIYRVGPGDPYTRRQTARILRVAARRFGQPKPCLHSRGYRSRFVRNRRRRRP